MALVLPLLTALAVLAAPLRLVLVLTCVLIGLTAQLALFAWVKPATARRIVTLWSRVMLLCLGVRLQVRLQEHSGQQQPRAGSFSTALYVSNHISWLDILSLQATAPVVFVAKSEIKHWPVLGWMVALAGTCFIERDRRTALRGVHNTLTQHLQAGQSVCIFPEGTTSSGAQVLPFHAGLLQAAIDAQVPIQTMRLDYSHAVAAYIDDMTLLGSLVGVLCTPRLSVQVQTLVQLPTQGAGTTRQTLALAAHSAISSAAALTLTA